MRRIVTTIVVSLGLLAAAVGVSSASAETLQPWFNLDSISRPGTLYSHSGLAPGRDEVQELVSAPGSLFKLEVNHTPVGAVPGFPALPGYFETEPFPLHGTTAPVTVPNLELALEAV
jgi:hypothetical protein